MAEEQTVEQDVASLVVAREDVQNELERRLRRMREAAARGQHATEYDPAKPADPAAALLQLAGVQDHLLEAVRRVPAEGVREAEAGFVLLALLRAKANLDWAIEWFQR